MCKVAPKAVRAVVVVVVWAVGATVEEEVVEEELAAAVAMGMEMAVDASVAAMRAVEASVAAVRAVEASVVAVRAEVVARAGEVSIRLVVRAGVAARVVVETDSEAGGWTRAAGPRAVVVRRLAAKRGRVMTGVGRRPRRRMVEAS